MTSDGSCRWPVRKPLLVAFQRTISEIHLESLSSIAKCANLGFIIPTGRRCYLKFIRTRALDKTRILFTPRRRPRASATRGRCLRDMQPQTGFVCAADGAELRSPFFLSQVGVLPSYKHKRGYHRYLTARPHSDERRPALRLRRRGRVAVEL